MGLAACVMRDLPGPVIEAMSPALTGGLVTTESPGKPIVKFTMILICCTTYQGYTLLGLPDGNRYSRLAEFSKLPRATHSVEEPRWQEVGFQSPSM